MNLKKTIAVIVISCTFLLLSCQYLIPRKQPLSSGINLANVDTTVRPQDNFYQYVNGNWLKTAKIPADKAAIGVLYELRDKADQEVKLIIEQLSAKQDLTTDSDKQKIRDLFRSYMDQETREQRSITPLQNALNNIQALKNKSDLIALFAKNQAMGMTTPMYIYVGVDARKSSQYAAHIWQYGLALPDRDYYLNQTPRFILIRANYLAHIKNIYQIAGLPNGAKAADNILALETAIAEKHWTKVATRDSEKRYNKYAITELKNLTRDIDWQVFIEALGLTTQKYIIINQPDYVQELGKIIQETPLNIWQDYLTFHAISTYSSYLTKELDDENFNFFSNKLGGLKQQKPQWKRAVGLVNSTLGDIIGKVYVERHFKPEAKIRMQALVENLRAAFGESIDELIWMSSETKKQAHNKLATFRAKIGYPDRWENYSDLKIKPNDLVGNIMRSEQVAYRKDIEKLSGPIRQWEWGMTPQTVNAYYSPTVNEIVFPAAILQAPFFNMAADDAVNYGGIGAVIGHEMGHGFDDQGSRYDAAGNLYNWWTEQDLSEFTKRTEGLIKQYNNYKVFDDLHVNGKLTLGENIGDLSGVSIAYKAYKTSLNGEAAPVIDGLTGDQRFFMGYAQVWRNLKVEEKIRKNVATDPHAPGEFRALGSLSNFDAFYEIYNIKKGDNMYIAPEKRVKIW